MVNQRSLQNKIPEYRTQNNTVIFIVIYLVCTDAFSSSVLVHNTKLKLFKALVNVFDE
jgi:hypothetical protein